MGRSPRDKHVARRSGSEAEVWWEANAATSPDAFAHLRADVTAHLHWRGAHVQDLWAGADEGLRVNVRMVTEWAWHAHFIRHLLRRPTPCWMASNPIGSS